MWSKILPLTLVLGAMPLAANAQQLTNLNDVVGKIVAQEQAEVRLLQQYAPLVETYIQYLRADNKAGAIPHGDKYFLGRAKLARGMELEPLDRPIGVDDKLLGGLKEFCTAEFVPRGFLQMIYVDAHGLDRSHYRFEHVRREFLGEVRCLVFDIDPLPKTGKGRFVGRIWVEDQDYQRVLMTSTLESFAMGHIIVLSRGLIDVLPDETNLAAILAHEMGHILLGHRINSQFGFFDNLHVSEKETFRHFDFARTPEEERAASRRATDLLRNSPYKNYQNGVQLFLQALKKRSKQISNLISPNLGDRVSTSWIAASAEFSMEPDQKTAASVIVALSIGGRIKIDPWNDQLKMLNSEPVRPIAASEKMPFQITHFVFYLTRQGDNSSPEASGPVAAQLPSDTKA